MSSTLQSLLKKHHLTTNGIHDIYKIPVNLIIDLTKKGIITRWEKNREEDAKRVEEIKVYTAKRGYMDGVISFAYHNDKLCCYDGNHRRMAINAKLSSILIDIIWKADNKIIVHEFNMINKAISVPEIYLSNNINNDTKDLIHKLVRDLSDKYHSHVSGSKSCKSPNFNRDLLTDNITAMLQKDIFDKYRAEEMIGYIELLNECYKNDTLHFNIRGKIKSQNIKDKCEDTGLWLFALQRDINESHLKKVIKSTNIV